MKKITLEDAIKILENCSAVIVDDDALMYINVNDNDEGAPLFDLNWTDSDDLEYSILCFKDANKTVTLNGNTLILIDDEKNEFNLTILIGGIPNDISVK